MTNMDMKAASVYTDFSGLENLKYSSSDDKQGELKEIAKQFESIMLQSVFKSMREANEVFKDNDGGSEGMQFYEEMLDNQLSLTLSDKGFGFSELLEKQFSASQMINPEQER